MKETAKSANVLKVCLQEGEQLYCMLHVVLVSTI